MRTDCSEPVWNCRATTISAANMAVCTMRKSAITRSVIREKPEAMPAGFISVVHHFLSTKTLVARHGHDCPILPARFPGNLPDGFCDVLHLTLRHRRK